MTQFNRTAIKENPPCMALMPATSLDMYGHGGFHGERADVAADSVCCYDLFERDGVVNPILEQTKQRIYCDRLKLILFILLSIYNY